MEHVANTKACANTNEHTHLRIMAHVRGAGIGRAPIAVAASVVIDARDGAYGCRCSAKAASRHRAVCIFVMGPSFAAM